MWNGHEKALVYYGLVMCDEWDVDIKSTDDG
jgi:hypothetical protein